MQTSGVLVGMRFHVTTGIRLGGKAVVGIVGFHHAAVVGVGLAEFQPVGGVVNPGGGIAIGTRSRVGGNISCRVAVGGEVDHVVCIIISKERGLACRAPFGHLATADIIAVVVTLLQVQQALQEQLQQWLLKRKLKRKRKKKQRL